MFSDKYEVFFKLTKVTDSDIQKLMDAKRTPLQYILSPDRSKVMTASGEVQLGSVLPYQVKCNEL